MIEASGASSENIIINLHRGGRGNFQKSFGIIVLYLLISNHSSVILARYGLVKNKYNEILIEIRPGR